MDTKKQQTAPPGPQNNQGLCDVLVRFLAPPSGEIKQRRNLTLQEGTSKSSLRYYGNALTFARLTEPFHVAKNNVRNLRSLSEFPNTQQTVRLLNDVQYIYSNMYGTDNCILGCRISLISSSIFPPPPQVNSWASQTKEDALTNPKTQVTLSVCRWTTW